MEVRWAVEVEVVEEARDAVEGIGEVVREEGLEEEEGAGEGIPSLSATDFSI